MSIGLASTFPIPRSISLLADVMEAAWYIAKHYGGRKSHTKPDIRQRRVDFVRPDCLDREAYERAYRTVQSQLTPRPVLQACLPAPRSFFAMHVRGGDKQKALDTVLRRKAAHRERYEKWLLHRNATSSNATNTAPAGRRLLDDGAGSNASSSTVGSSQADMKELLRDDRTWVAMAAIIRQHPHHPWYVLSDTKVLQSYAEERLVRVGARLGAPLKPCAPRGGGGSSGWFRVAEAEAASPPAQQERLSVPTFAVENEAASAVAEDAGEPADALSKKVTEREAKTRAAVRDFFTLNTAAGVVAIVPDRADGLLKGHGESSFATVAALAGDAPLLFPAPSSEPGVLARIEAECFLSGSQRPLRGVFFLEDVERYIAAVGDSRVRFRNATRPPVANKTRPSKKLQHART